MDPNLAVGLRAFGGPEMLEVVELPRREPAPGEALVRVRAATVNPTDTLLRAGVQEGRLRGIRPPYVPGMELAGEVLAVRPRAEADGRIQVGDRVAGIVPPWRSGGGAQARFVAVDLRSLVHVPEGLDDVEAATLPMNGLTALTALELLEPASHTILVTGGPGALGGYVLSIARNRGHRTIADGKDSDRALLHALGASVVVPRGEGVLSALAAVAADGVDGIIDAARLGTAVSPALRAGGVLVEVRPGEEPIGDDRIRVRRVSVPTQIFNTSKLEEVMRLAKRGVIRPRIARVLPIEAAAEAHRLLAAGGLRGRLVLDLT